MAQGRHHPSRPLRALPPRQRLPPRGLVVTDGASPDVNLDFERADRIGIHEAVLAEPKSTAQLVTVLEHALDAGRPMLLTRMSGEQYRTLPPTLRADLDHDLVSGTAYFGAVPSPVGPARTAVVCAGTSDRPVAAEAERTLHFAGHRVLSVADVGVAGLWRILDRIDELATLDVVIVVAGMDGALPTVLSGLVPGVIIAVPTSVGYGVSDQGRTALHASLASCGPGLVVVNIDNGYGAATAALRVLGLHER
ncbi:MAG: nickel pincer cofactor biosynthesis protein LarB [Actinomycetia bacterium]|nr:nickel pincer cofactor biosynthesis protein LarB [Actinomycetes bacterium]